MSQNEIKTAAEIAREQELARERQNRAEVSRRDVLKTFLASGIAKSVITSSPLVSGLLFARHNDAHAMNTPDKSLVIYVPGGGIHDLWAPSGNGSGMVMGPMSNGYDPVKTECNFLLNASHSGGGHGSMPRLLTDSWHRDSFEVTVGKTIGADRPFTYVNLGTHSNGNGYLTRDNGSSVPFQDNPFTAFNLLFGENNGGSPKTPILDAHADAANAIRSKLAGYEIQRMDEHLQAISDTQRRLDELAGGSTCTTAPDNDEFPISHATFTQQAKMQGDIAVAALKCGLTSSVSMGFGNHQSNFRIPELNYQDVYHQSIHGGSGGAANYPHYTEMRNHLGSLTAYAIGRLRDEGILDSTIVAETTDMGHADLHGDSDVPLLLAGGGSAINRGVTNPVGPGYNNLDLIHTAGLALGITIDFGREVPGILA